MSKIRSTTKATHKGVFGDDALLLANHVQATVLALHDFNPTDLRHTAIKDFFWQLLHRFIYLEILRLFIRNDRGFIHCSSCSINGRGRATLDDILQYRLVLLLVLLLNTFEPYQTEPNKRKLQQIYGGKALSIVQMFAICFRNL